MKWIKCIVSLLAYKQKFMSVNSEHKSIILRLKTHDRKMRHTTEICMIKQGCNNSCQNHVCDKNILLHWLKI